MSNFIPKMTCPECNGGSLKCIRCNGDGKVDSPEALLRQLVGLLTPKSPEVVMTVQAQKQPDPEPAQEAPKEQSIEDLEGDIRYSGGILYECEPEDCTFDWSGKGQKLVLDFGAGGYIKQTVKGARKYEVLLELKRLLIDSLLDRKAELEDALEVLQKG